MYNCNFISYNLITKYNHKKLNSKIVKVSIDIDFEKIYQNNNNF
jgi:hypothetical protein